MVEARDLRVVSGKGRHPPDVKGDLAEAVYLPEDMRLGRYRICTGLSLTWRAIIGI